MRRLVTTFLVIFFCSVLCAGTGAQDFSSLIAQGDAAWEKRGTDADPDNQKALDFYLGATKLAPYSYEAHWKAARSLWWISDQLLALSDDRERQSALGKRGMALAERAVLIDPTGVEGHLYYAVVALHYAYGVGMINTLKEGIDDDIVRHLFLAYEKDKTFAGGLIPLSLSGLYRRAPWPMRDTEKALAYAREALLMDPSGIRTAVFAAASLEAAGVTGEAMELLRKASEMEGNKDLEPDYKRWRRLAGRCVDEGRVIDPDRLF